jgi:hypothetical protein
MIGGGWMETMLQRRTDRQALYALMIACTLLFGAMLANIFAIGGLDYGQHVVYAQQIAENGVFSNSHPLYQFLVIIAARLGLGYAPAGLIVTVLTYLAGGFVVYRLLRRATAAGRVGAWVAALLALALLIVAPITLLTWGEQNLNNGYIQINTHHSPTIALLKPLALLLFFYVVRALDGELVFSAKAVLIGAALTALSLIAKPNYTMSLLPALVLMLGLRVLRGSQGAVKLLGVAVIGVGILVLGLQYLYQFISVDDGGGIRLAPLMFVSSIEPSVPRQIAKFVLSILFPLCVYLLYFRTASKSTALNLAWLTFFAGAAQFYLFVEQGWRLYFGNFQWGAQMALFVLFVTSMICWLRELRDHRALRDWRAWLCAGLFLLHAISGVAFLLVQFSPNVDTFWAWF